MSAARSAQPVNLVYRFGPYELDTARNQLRKFGLRIRLERKPLQLLIALLEHAGEVVTRSELQRSLWGEEVYVDFDKGLTVAAAKLRAALSDSSEQPKYIETVAGEGYRFIAAIERAFVSSSSISGESDRKQLAVLPAVAISDQLPVSQSHVRQLALQRPNARFAAAVAVCIALTVMGSSVLVWRRSAQPLAAKAGKIMIVVLPFENLSGDPAQEYLSDGMTEELSQKLGNLNNQQLGVIGRTSAMTYKYSKRTIRQIGEELAVSYVLEGSVRRERSKLRVTAQLVKVSDQAHVWAQDYDGEVRDLLRVEDDVASEIARQVGVAIASGQPAKSVQAHVPNPESHEAYLLARYYWNKRTPAGWAAGEQYFRLAVEKDPHYAAAYAGLAECRIPKEEALAAATKAVELDPGSGEAYTALGWVELFRNLDVAAAERTLKTAVQLDPNYAPAHHTYSHVLEVSGRVQDAITEEHHAVALDPLAPISRASLAEVLSLAGQNDRAVEQLKLVFAMEPQFPKAHESLGTIDLRRGMYKEAIREYQLSAQYGGERPLGLVGYAYARSGNKDEALAVVSELQELAKKSHSGEVFYDLALVEIGLGNRNKALAWLQKEYEQHDDDGLLFLNYDPIYDPLRSDPRFQALLGRMNFPQWRLPHF
jgi:TolB-like protein/DNA-binding winged helix-turn-helix (wHTH) protein/tetratricopeptide (TPR) repeat protein